MSFSISAPNYSSKHIKEKAEAFLHEYHPSLSVPVPIEEIIEFELNINIVPLHGLHRAFEIDGFTSNDLSTISVDAFVQESRPGRYRFTLAHEVGHVVLHRNFFLHNIFESVSEWKDFTQSISPRDYGIIEWQAYQFAGLVLVPAKVLRAKYHEAIELARKTGVVSGKDIQPPAQQYIANWLAKQFVVSPEVIEKSLQRDKL